MAAAEIPHPQPRTHPFLQPRSLALVAGGGAVGTTARHLLETAFAPASGAVPWVTLVINVTGAFLLGALLTVLGRTGADVGWRRRVRLGVGTGALGGYTTYSTFAVEVCGLLGAGHTWAGTGYAAGTVLAGVAAAGLGLLLARWLVPLRGVAL
ncbi:MAG TPA: CrcB family protein [Ruania sp.]|nr:CrcB family protein [Ruania sp.]